MDAICFNMANTVYTYCAAHTVSGQYRGQRAAEIQTSHPVLRRILRRGHKYLLGLNINLLIIHSARCDE